ncbi:FtsK/SpoIIIE family DNA translocase [Paenibacillus contaminans]|uniref:DNA translocase FtsK n=1 Tax=Paenibacillus contaminans TaxID=450362 RepID=A0A329MTV4_9BACL|nr:DNA translocase FtsK [Paenibacillus contaminans]RAV22768.1 DNA translocase FtsK [Paenibacillus contaminans]
MAKGRKKKRKLKLSIKYELYGIIILVLSVIALSREGRVARSLTYLFRFLIGAMDWVIPVVFIYIGLYVFIKRAWPGGWSVRKTGLVLLLGGLVLYNHMSMIHLLDPNADFTAPSYIVSSTWQSMMDGLQASGGKSNILQTDVGGGMIGAILYACLYFLFGGWGSRFLVYALFVVSFLLITGLSVVDIGGRIGRPIGEMAAALRSKYSELFSNRSRSLVPISAPQEESGKPSKRKAYVPPLDDDFEEETYASAKPVKKNEKKADKKSPIFHLLPSLRKQRENLVGLDRRDDEEEELDEIQGQTVHQPAVQKGAKPITVIPAAVNEQQFPNGGDEETDDDQRPYIRDFQEQREDTPMLSGPAQATSGSASSSDDKADEVADTDKPLALASSKKPYQLPSYQLLSKPSGSGRSGDLDHKANARKLEATLESFGVRAKVLEVVHGPSVTRYEVQPDVGVKVSRIVSLTDDIALALAAKDIRMEAPIPGKSAIGIEVPNSEVSVVTLREVMESSAFHDAASKLSVTLGRDIAGQPIVGNLARMPHMLVAGATGSGKSVCINGIITSILYKAKPDEVKFLMIDPKMVELNVYNGIPHLLAPVVTDPRRASLALKKVVVEMEKRYELFSKSGTRNIEGYNAMLTDPGNPNPGDPLPFIVVIVDELADLMMVAAGDVEDAICRLAQMARAAGIHLIIATQRPSVDVITGVIKANIPSRIAFGVSSQVDSRTILDMVGAEKLLGRGDMLYLPVGASKPVRVQGAFLSDQEVESVVTFVRNQEQANYQEEMVPQLEEQTEQENLFEDELYDQAVQIVLEGKQASVSLLQRRMRVGYTRAARLIDTMEAKGVVGPYEGSKPREVLMTIEQFHAMKASS